MTYLDFAAATPIHPEVLEAMLPFYSKTYGNPSSVHSIGVAAKNAVNEARDVIAECIGAHPEEIFFTSGTTESINLALHHFERVIFPQTEHDATRECARNVAHRHPVVVDAEGSWKVSDIVATLEQTSPENSVVTASWVNNELGTIGRIHELAIAIERYNKTHRPVFLHVDAAQAFLDVDVDMERTPVHMLSFGAGKIYGPKGVGVLYLRKNTPRRAFMFGGKQQEHLRPGTENVPGIVGMAHACRIMVAHRQEYQQHIGAVKETFLQELQTEKIVYRQNGPKEKTSQASHILSLTFPGLDAEEIIFRLDAKGVCASAASACRSGSGPSDTLRAIGLSQKDIESTVRFSFGHTLTLAEVKQAAQLTATTIRDMIQWKKDL
jgi:cysteine desulfurase